MQTKTYFKISLKYLPWDGICKSYNFKLPMNNKIILKDINT